MNLSEWAGRWGVPAEAMAELLFEFGAHNDGRPPSAFTGAPQTEAAVQVDVRLEASKLGARLWRNNAGMAYDDTGRAVRYGLGNDSKAINDRIKTPDLIGIKPLLIKHYHVGHTVGVFLCREIKPARWRYTGKGRERAQLNFLELAASLGADASFATGVGTI